MRPCLQTTIRRGNGEPDPDAEVYVLVRGTAFELATYTAASGGSLITQPITPDADGNVCVYPSVSAQIDVKVDYSDGTTATRPVDVTAASIDAWTAPTFTNSWTNYGSGYLNAGYTIDSFGIVHLRGVITNAAPGTSAFTLPAGYRPSAQRRFIIRSLVGPAACSIGSGGAVTITSGTTLWDLSSVRMPL